MIDINNLRRKLRSDDLIDHIDIHANVKSTLAELMDRLEAAEKSDAESIRMYRKSRDERDKLRKALQALVEHFEYYIGDNECRPLENARAALEESK